MSGKSTADPVAEKSAFLRMYMSSHPDTLVAYAKWYGKVQETMTAAEMTAIDTKSMTLTCTLKGGAKKEVYIPIEPPLKGYDDVKPRLLEMKALAQEGLGMIQTPRIATFSFPPDAAISIPVMSILAYCTFSPPSPSPLFYVASLAQQYLGMKVLYGLSYTIMTFHVLESLYTIHLCRKHRTGLAVGAMYVASTLLCGLPVVKGLRQQIQGARIDSVMKVE